MVSEPRLYTAKVMHRRVFPKENSFSYGVYYLALPLPAQKIPGRLASFYPQDLGKRDGTDPLLWVQSILSSYGFNDDVKDIILITMPRILGYVFNPVSFYLCLDEKGVLRAVLCDVHNTFGEQHSYLCAHPDHAPIKGEDWLEAEKLFHVSPFLAREGSYKFRFDLRQDGLGVFIDYYDAHGRRQLVTSLMGTFSPLNKKTLNRAFWRHPCVTLKAIFLIHWQALRLIAKGIRYVSKPDQHTEKISATRNLGKM